jgi:N-acetylmuramoyl-L-alanine amidase
VGHGGKDNGAIGINGIMKKDVVLQLANEILRLNKGQNNLEVYLTRYSDSLISLTDRTRLAKALKADIFISLHCNHAKNPGATGTEVYVANAALSKNLRQSISELIPVNSFNSSTLEKLAAAPSTLIVNAAGLPLTFATNITLSISVVTKV